MNMNEPNKVPNNVQLFYSVALRQWKWRGFCRDIGVRPARQLSLDICNELAIDTDMRAQKQDLLIKI